MQQSHAHADITEPWRQKAPAENNNPEEEEEVKKLTPHTHTPQPNV